MTGGSKCDCLMVLLLDLAVKWDWHPSCMFDTDWQLLRVPKFQICHSCCTRYKGYCMPWCWYVNKSGYYFFVGKRVVELSVCFVWFLQSTPCTCIYLVPSISSSHAVYFCVMSVPVKCKYVFLFSTCNIWKKHYLKANIAELIWQCQYIIFPDLGNPKLHIFVGFSLPTPSALYFHALYIRHTQRCGTRCVLPKTALCETFSTVRGWALTGFWWISAV